MNRGHDGGVLGGRVLARTEDVEVAEHDRLDAVELAQRVDVVLAPRACSRRTATAGPAAWSRGRAASPGCRRSDDEPGEHDPAHAVAGRGEHDLDRAVHVGVVGRPRVDDRAGDRRDRGLVEDHLAARGRPIERRRVEDAALDQRDPIRTGSRRQREPGRQVVDHRDLVAAREEGADEVVTDEPGAAGDENPHSQFLMPVPRYPATAAPKSSNASSSHILRERSARPPRCSASMAAATS